MSEVLVVIGGLALGYAIVSLLMSGKPGDGSMSAAGVGVEKQGAEAHWSQVLGVPPDAEATEIRAAYRRALSQYHPDKVDGLGAELRELAHRKSQEITEAYRQAMAERGEPE